MLATGIPHKGRVLTQLSLFWFDFLSDIVPNHLITADVEQLSAGAAEYADAVARALDAGAAGRDVSRRVCGAGIYFGLGLEGI